MCNNPLIGFRSNSKFDEILECSGLKYAQPITTKFGTGVQIFFLIDRMCYEQKHYKISLNFKFNRNIVSGTGALKTFVKPHQFY